MLNREFLLDWRKSLTLEILLGCAIACGIFLRILNLATRELWYDEVLSLLLSAGQRSQYALPSDSPIALSHLTALLDLPRRDSFAKTIQGLLRGLYSGEPHPPIFFFVQHFWLRLFGNREIAMRSLPALWSLGAIASAYGLGRKLLDHRGGLLFAALIATNPFYLFHSLNVRMYTPLVFWAILSVWALLELQTSRPRWHWQILFVLSIAGGLLTFYLFAYWIGVVAVLILLLDRPRWLQHGIRLAISGLITLPWAIWGTLKQLKNADLDRFGVREGHPLFLHIQDLLHTLGVHLVLGDWVTSLPTGITAISGLLAGCGLAIAIVYLWRSSQKTALTVGLAMGILPLLLALCVDVVMRKYTLGFGWGRALTFVLPGCLFLIALAIHQLKARQSLIALALLLCYLTIDVSDLTLRTRSMFHQVADTIAIESASTLIAMDTQAWGHVNRLAYYIPSNRRVDLLAQPAAKLADALKPVLSQAASPYRRVIWLESAAPIWSPPATEQDRQKIHQVLGERFTIAQTKSLQGTMNLDEFHLSLYQVAR